MPFQPKNHSGNAKIYTVTFGTDENTVSLGGGSALPFYQFDAPTQPRPRIGIELTDGGMAAVSQPQLREFYHGCASVAEMAKQAQELAGVDFLCLRFEGADPNGENRSVADCVALAVSVRQACSLPLAIMGCHHAEKDAQLFTAVAASLSDETLLLLSAREENYTAVAPIAKHLIGAESAVDINLAKQLNVLLTQSGVAATRIVMNVGAAAVGYGFEYLVSTMERIRTAALLQGDELLQMPIVTPVAADAWSVKESVLPEQEQPDWGDAEQRGISMEVTTAAACMAAGADAVIVRHPASVRALTALTAALV